MSSRPSGASLKPLVFEARGHLAMSPEALWPLVADTARLNRAIGLPPVHYNGSPAKAGGVARAEYRFWGIPFVRWNEHPFEIDAPRRYAVRRVFHWGPIAAAYGGVELTRDVEGTDLRVFAELTPRYALGVPVARLIGSRLVERIYRQCRVFEQYNAGQRPTPFPQLSPGESANDRLQALAAELATVVPNAALVERIRLHLAAAPDEDVAHMRVYELADRWGFDRRETLIAFLHATTVGLTTMSWEVLCPNCRVSKAAYSSLRELREQAHCDVCNAVFDASFDRLVEVRFAVAPAIRQVEVHPFCLGGPMNAPHVVAQTRIEPGTTQVWSGWLTPGEYRLRTSPPVPIGANSWSPGGEGADLSPLPAVPEPGPTRGGGWRLPLSAPAPIRNERGQGHDGSRRTLRESAGESVSIRAIERAVEHQVSIAITPERIEPEAATVAPGEVALVTSNQAGAPILLQVERAEWPDTIVTAATVSTVQEFRDLFSSEALAPGLLLSIQRLTFVFTDLTGSTALYQRLSQARAFRLVQEHFVILGAAIAANRGAIVKTIGDAVMAVFPTARDAVAAACAMQRDIRKLDTAGLADPTRLLKIGIHEGPSLVANQAGKLDYFGTTVNIASRVEHVATGGEIVATGAVCDQPDVGALIERERLSAEAGEVPLRGIVEPVQIRRLRVP